MAIAGDTPADRQLREVLYYGQPFYVTVEIAGQVINMRRQKSPMAKDLDNMMWSIRDGVSAWPAHDLFPIHDDPWHLVSVSIQ